MRVTGSMRLLKAACCSVLLVVRAAATSSSWCASRRRRAAQAAALPAAHQHRPPQQVPPAAHLAHPTRQWVMMRLTKAQPCVEAVVAAALGLHYRILHPQSPLHVA